MLGRGGHLGRPSEIPWPKGARGAGGQETTGGGGIEGKAWARGTWGRVGTGSPEQPPHTPARAQGEVSLAIIHAFCSPVTVSIVIGLARLWARGELCPGLGSDGQAGSRPAGWKAERDPLSV